MADASYGTHLPALIRAVLEVSGPVVELGCGWLSTPMLHSLCAGRCELISLDSDPRWVERMAAFRAPWHRLETVASWSRLPPLPERIGVALIDQAPGKDRVPSIIMLRQRVTAFVCHDADSVEHYGWEPLLSSFAYRRVHMSAKPWTAIVSDAVDPGRWPGLIPDATT